MSGKAIRDNFIAYFQGKGHKHLPSSSLVPKSDPTMLLTIAGMVQFKPIFMGLEKPAQSRAVTVQKCIRTNDLDNVGRTARHHTFFQMLGNFSFGDYFKAEVIPWAWEFLTRELGIPEERLWVSIFVDDDESLNIWHEKVGVPLSRIVRMGEDDNFWAAGPTGPCGPCSEIYVDLGPQAGNGNPDAILGEDDARFLEVWNLVFMEFNRNEHGALTPLPKKSIDTGMGLERIASVMQGVANNYETDLLFPILQAAAKLSGKTYGADASTDVSLKVITDHLRASVFLIADGVVPGNEGRGYVLRRIIRRAYRHGRLIGIEGSFLHGLSELVVSIYGDFFMEVSERRRLIEETLFEEEKRFGATIERGMALLEAAMNAVDEHKELDGLTAFELYDTYGFPLELTIELAEERGIRVNSKDFESAMEAQRDRARQAREKAGISFEASATSAVHSEFLGYDLISETDTVADILDLGKGKKGLILNRTPFYAESGGQVGDTGVLVRHSGQGLAGELTFANHKELVAAEDVIRVFDTQKRHNAIVHVVSESAAIKVGDRLLALVDETRRWHIRRHHSATHLLHAALRQVLGTQVTQAGSQVGPDALRFDFTLARAMTQVELREVEAIVNQQVLENSQVHTDIMDAETARHSGAMALFDEKYGDAVRVLSMGTFSKELCGGTHVRHTGDIGLFLITSEAGIAAGVRRIEAVAGLAAYQAVRGMDETLSAVGASLKAAPADVPERLDKLQEALKHTEKQVKLLQAQLATAQVSSRLGEAKEAGGLKYLAIAVNGMPSDASRQAVESLLAGLKSGVVLLVNLTGDKLSTVAAVSEDAAERGIQAGAVLSHFMARVGGKGSGRGNFAQGGGGDAALVPAALADFGAMLEDLASSMKA